MASPECKFGLQPLGLVDWIFKLAVIQLWERGISMFERRVVARAIGPIPPAGLFPLAGKNSSLRPNEQLITILKSCEALAALQLGIPRGWSTPRRSKWDCMNLVQLILPTPC